MSFMRHSPPQGSSNSASRCATVYINNSVVYCVYVNDGIIMTSLEFHCHSHCSRSFADELGNKRFTTAVEAMDVRLVLIKRSLANKDSIGDAFAALANPDDLTSLLCRERDPKLFLYHQLQSQAFLRALYSVIRHFGYLAFPHLSCD